MKRADSQFRKLATHSIDKATATGFDSLDEKERVAYCVQTLETEVVTGGFRNYLWGAYGDHALETVAVLDKIGASQTARLLRQSFRVFPNRKPPRETFTRQREIMRAPRTAEGLEVLDHRFFEQEEDLALLAMAYVLSLP